MITDNISKINDKILFIFLNIVDKYIKLSNYLLINKL